MAAEMQRRDVLKTFGGMIAAGTAGAMSAPRALRAQRRFDGETLRAQFWAGPEGQTIQTHVVEPFMKRTGAKVVVTEGVTSLSLAKMRAEKAKPSNTIYLIDDFGVAPAGREGLLEPLDLAMLPNAVDVDPKFFIEGRGIGFFTGINSIVYNTELVKTPPTSWKALWDPQFARKIAIPPATHGSSFRLAVMAAMLNGGDQYNMEPAWDALKQLKANVAYMETNTAVLAELLKNGEISMAFRLPYYFKEYIAKGYPIGVAVNLQEGVFASIACAAIAKNHPDKKELAYAFVNECLSPDAQARMAEALWFGPTNRKVKLAPEVAKNLLATQAQWDSIIPLNLDNLTARREEWIQKYTRALA
jgi:putative spermidine/putrescine transport system substrate-binding protein